MNGLTLFHDKRGTWDSANITVWSTGERAHLYPPPAGAPIERVELDADRPVWDEETAAAIAREVKRSNEFDVVETAEKAEYVFLVEAQHQTLASFRALKAGVGGIDRLGGDREANFLMAVFGLLVPADAYRTQGVDIASLLTASVWNGVALARSGHEPVLQDDGQDGLKPKPGVRPVTGVSRWVPASVELLVGQLQGRTQRPPGFPPLCAASIPAARGDASDPIVLHHVNDALDARGLASSRTGAAPRTLTSGVTYVSLPVTVTDARGRAVLDLTDTDFRIYEDDREQQIDRLTTMSAAINLALVVDTSSSMRYERPELQMAIRTFVETLRPDDRVLLSSFNDRLFVEAEFTGDRGRLHRAVSALARGQGTRLYDTIALLIVRRMQAIPDRKAIVLLTDGVDTRSRLVDAEGTTRLLSESHVPVYVVQYDTRRNDYSLPFGIKVKNMTIRDMKPVLLPEGAEDNTQLFMRADSYLAAVSDVSGGRLYHAESLPNLQAAFRQVAKELGEQYTIGYYPANQQRDGTFRRLRVEVNRPNVQVKARTGYRAPSGR